MARAMEQNRPVWTTLAGCLCTLGSTVLIFKATWRSEVEWWTDPVFWLGVGVLAAGLSIFVLLLLPPHLRSRRARRELQKEHEREGRANMWNGLSEIMAELGETSSLLKAELRWGKRGPLFPNTAWAKNQHLVTGDAHALVADAYQHTHQLDLATLSAAQPELDGQETEARQTAKEIVDAAFDSVRELRDRFEP
jgi:hypothetical protein